jgi:hypothetical protein
MPSYHALTHSLRSRPAAPQRRFFGSQLATVATQVKRYVAEFMESASGSRTWPCNAEALSIEMLSSS